MARSRITKSIITRATAPARAVRIRIDRAALLRTLGVDIGRRHRELDATGLFTELDEANRRWKEAVEPGTTPAGKPLRPGGLDYSDGTLLYSLVRTLRPQVVVETGVCNGFSSAFLLTALVHNGSGRLYSIDLPSRAEERDHGAAVLPAGEDPGWVVPPELREPWELLLGSSRELLPPLLGRVGPIGFFLHDSDHRYEAMRWELGTAMASTEVGGVVAADNVGSNSAFSDFAASEGCRMYRVGARMAAAIRT